MWWEAGSSGAYGRTSLCACDMYNLFCLSVELVYGLWPAVPGLSVQVAGFSLPLSICTLSVQSILYRDMIIFRNSNT